MDESKMTFGLNLDYVVKIGSEMGSGHIAALTSPRMKIL